MEITTKMLQDAIKDINTVLGPVPKLSIIAPKHVHQERIIGAISGAIQAGHDLVHSLNAATKDLYNFLIKAEPPPVVDPGPEGTVATVAGPEDTVATTRAPSKPPCFGVSYDEHSGDCTAESCFSALSCRAEATGVPLKYATTRPRVKRERVKQARTRYGHLVGTMNETLDDLLAAGCTQEEAVKALVEKHGRTDIAAARKFSLHMAHLRRKKSLTINVIYKAAQETI